MTKKMNLRQIFSSVLLALMCVAAMAQTKSSEKAQEYYKSKAFSQAIAEFESIKSLSASDKRTLADCYAKTRDYHKAERCYSELIGSEDALGIDHYNFGYVLLINEKYNDAEEAMATFSSMNPFDTRGREFVKQPGYHVKLLRDDGIFELENLPINSPQQDFGPAYYGENMIVFASNRKDMISTKKTWSGNQLPYLDMYKWMLDSPDGYPVELFQKSLNDQYHEGPATFNKVADFMVFTRNNYNAKNRGDVRKLQLFSSRLDEKGRWSKPNSLPFNDSEYSVGHPCLSKDGKTLYFSSDLPGGYGGVDLYKSDLIDGIHWSDPENLGPDVNSEGNEMFPFVQDDGLLFFASDGHPGLGGLDLFVSVVHEDGRVDQIRNMGAPINSHRDDFGILVNSSQGAGYISSNRDGGMGDDDIYSFVMHEPIHLGSMVFGKVVDEEGKGIPDADVVLHAASTNREVDRTVTDEEGEYTFAISPKVDYEMVVSKESHKIKVTPIKATGKRAEVKKNVTLEPGATFTLNLTITDSKIESPLEGAHVTIMDLTTMESVDRITSANGFLAYHLNDRQFNSKALVQISLSKDGYLSKTLSYATALNSSDPFVVNDLVDLSMSKIEVGDDLSATAEMVAYDVKDIFYDYNEATLRDDAKVVLDKVVQIMNDNPELEIELASHTDCRGTVEYNLQLSEQRAMMAAQYVKERISNPVRIFGTGYGESQLIYDCGCEEKVGRPCSEQEHQANRRTEFKVIKL